MFLTESPMYLGNWKYEGIIYKKIQDPMGREGNRLLFAPDVQQGLDGRYYLYYAFDFLGVISVAVCDSPAGKFEFYGHVHYKNGTLLGDREGDMSDCCN
jgi:arabinoxylan arabinofuranohydrolase